MQINYFKNAYKNIANIENNISLRPDLEMDLYNGNIGAGVVSRGKWTQAFWQNRLAQKNGNLYPKLFNSGTDGLKIGVRGNLSSVPSYLDQRK